LPHRLAEALFGHSAKQRHVRAGAESPAGTGQNDDPYLAVPFGFLHRGADFFLHDGGPGVELVRAMQRDRRDALGDGVKDLLVCHTGTALYTIAAA